MMRPTLIMPETFEDCLTYTKQLRKLYEESTNYETTAHANETFATKESLNGYETTEHANETFATKASLNDYETTAHANETFATKESLNDYETTAHATETYATKSELQNVHIVVDDTVSSNSQNAVSSKGIFDFVTDQTADLATVEDLNTKQDTLTFDETPTLNSPNPATSGGIYDSIKAVKESMDDYTPLPVFNQYKEQVNADYLGKDEASATYVSQQILSVLLDQYEPKAHAENTYATKLELNNYPTTQYIAGEYATKTELNNYPTKQYIAGEYATKTELNAKQDLLLFDSVPTLGSTNPVTSEGIYNAIKNISAPGFRKVCEVTLGYSSNDNRPSVGYHQTVNIFANGNDGDPVRYGFSDFDVQISNPDLINNVSFSYLLLYDFNPNLPMPNCYPNSFPNNTGYGPESGGYLYKIGPYLYVIDVLTIAFNSSDGSIYTVYSSSNSKNDVFYMNIDNDTFKTLTKGHITYKFTLLI